MHKQVALHLIVFISSLHHAGSNSITTMTVARHHMNLLYITADETSHYVLVKDLSRLISIQYNNHKGKHYFCQYYLDGCTSEEALKNYMERCKLHGTQRIKIPEADNKKGRGKIKFTKIEYQQSLPFVFYADFKSVLRKFRVSHRHRNPSPSNTSITYHVGTAST